MLNIHRVRLESGSLTKEVLVLATSARAACSAATKQTGAAVRVAYLGLSEGLMLGDQSNTEAPDMAFGGTD